MSPTIAACVSTGRCQTLLFPLLVYFDRQFRSFAKARPISMNSFVSNCYFSLISMTWADENLLLSSSYPRRQAKALIGSRFNLIFE